MAPPSKIFDFCVLKALSDVLIFRFFEVFPMPITLLFEISGTLFEKTKRHNPKLFFPG